MAARWNDLCGQYSCICAVFGCFTLALLYVGSLYVWPSKHNRDHPSTIKQRFISVTVMMFISPFIMYIFIREESLQKAGGMLNLLGLKFNGAIAASTLPLLLTMILFFGPLLMQGFNGILPSYLDSRYWSAGFQDVIWLRNHVVAPLSEEFTYRACMMPLLLQCFGLATSVMICPLFFGVAHFHHLVEKIKSGMEIHKAVIGSVFQCFYTTLFGMYSAYLFARTGHFMAPFVVHAFCNHMGFPDFGEVLTYKEPRRLLTLTAFVLGLTGWLYLYEPMTTPWLYVTI